MFKYLYHFTRTPPGLKRFGVLKPMSHDLHSSVLEGITPESLTLYANRRFIFTIPKSYLEAWEKSGQLDSLLDMIVKLEWQKYSVEQWSIDTSNIDISQALIRESHYISPQALGFNDMNLTSEQKREYNEAYKKMINSVQNLNEYNCGFVNPEILLPFEVDLKYITLEKLIE